LEIKSLAAPILSSYMVLPSFVSLQPAGNTLQNALRAVFYAQSSLLSKLIAPIFASAKSYFITKLRDSMFPISDLKTDSLRASLGAKGCFNPKKKCAFSALFYARYSLLSKQITLSLVFESARIPFPFQCFLFSDLIRIPCGHPWVLYGASTQKRSALSALFFMPAIRF
jgi:hypothetical protein